MSTLRTNSIQTTGGRTILQSTGSVIQVVQGQLGSTFSGTSADNGNSGYLIDVAGLSATITPTSNTSRILIFTQLYMGCTTAASGYQQHFTIKRNGSIISALKGTNEGGRPTVSGRINMYAINTYSMMCLTGVHYDSPGSASALTYQIAAGGYSGSPIIYVNRQETYQNFNSSSNYDTVPLSTITLMEISA